MKIYSNHGKYTQTTKKQKKSSLIRVLLTILFVVLTLLVGMIILLMCGFGAQEPAPPSLILTQPTATVTMEPTIPTVSATTETVSPTTMQIPPSETEPNEKQILPQYISLYEQNADMLGWLKIEDTRIDYPVMHTPDDPEKYLHLNFEEKYSYAGVPFLDAKCSADSDNLLIYGHNMASGSMFSSLMKYQEKTYWEQHPVIKFDTLYEEQEYEVLAAFYDRVYYKTEDVFKFYQFIDAVDEADYDNAISQFKEKALYDTGVDASYGDQLITLVTCAYHTENGRFVVVARRK